MPEYTTRPVDTSMWRDVEAVLGPQGGDDGCWCMGWRSPSHLPADEAKDALRSLVEGAGLHAILAYDGETPVGWCSLGPRATFVHADRALRAAPGLADASTSWSVVCFFVKPEHRGAGLANTMLLAAVELARAHGAAHLEGFPFDAAVQDEQSRRDGDNEADWAFVESLDLFQRCGFRPTDHCMNGCLRPVVRDL